MQERASIRLQSLRKMVLGYHVVSAIVGIFLLSPFLFGALQRGDLSRALGPLFFIVMYVPFVLVSIGFLRLKRWAYFGLLGFYLLEIVAAPPFFEFKLSLFHYSILFLVSRMQLGIDVVSPVISVFLILIGKDYLAQAK